MPNRDAGQLRPRAAFLHISKCAGTSVYSALSAAAGNPVPPPQQFDTCYVDGVDEPALLSEAARSAVAWDDQPTAVGTHVFYNHWSLPTLRRHFAPADIATVLREPMTRVLSFVEFMRSLPAAFHRHWYPDTVPMSTARLPLVDLLGFGGASRSTDNLIARQVLWGDSRLPSKGFIEPSHCDALARDAVQRLTQLGVVAVVESGELVWQQLSTWIGVPLTVERRNETPLRQLPGVFRTAAEVAAAEELLYERTTVDRQVWAHFAAAAGVHAPAELVARRVGERLRRWCSSAFFAGFTEGPEPAEAAPVSAIARALDAAVAPGATTLIVGGGDDLCLSTAGRHITVVVAGDGASAPANTVVRVVEPDLVNLRDTLAGRDFDAIVVGSGWMGRRAPVRLFEQLAEIAAPHTALVVVGHRATAPLLRRALHDAGWATVTEETQSERVLVHARDAQQSSGQGKLTPVADANDERQMIIAQLTAVGGRVLTLRSPDDVERLGAPEPGEEGSFDTVVLDGVLAHVHHPAVVLLQALARVVPGGSLVLSIPNLGHADVRLAVLDGRVPYSDRGLLDDRTVHWFTAYGVRELVDVCDLEVVEWRGVERAPGTTELALDADVGRLAERWFCDDPDATAYEWVLRCRPRTDGVAAPAPSRVAPPRRFLRRWR